jgi:ribosome-interacting GTPase 1
MIKECPKHKSSENMLKNLKNRLRKLQEGVERKKKSGKSSQSGIKKMEIQCVSGRTSKHRKNNYL